MTNWKSLPIGRDCILLVMGKTSAQRSAATPAFAQQLPLALLSAFKTNNRINQYLIHHLSPVAWKTKPSDGKGRAIPAIVAHMHNVRVMWLKTTAKGSDIPAQLDPASPPPKPCAHWSKAG
jgi:uncharacterized damage-inducible protein DinB